MNKELLMTNGLEFDSEINGEHEGEFSSQAWEDESSRRRPMSPRRRSTRPRAGARGQRGRPRPVRVWGASEYVRWLQSVLNQIMDLRLPLDGLMGTATRSALRSFQKRQGLPVNGLVGPETEQALLAARGGHPPAKRATQPAEPKPPDESPSQPSEPEPPDESPDQSSEPEPPETEYTQFSVEPFVFVRELAEAENGGSLSQEWEDESSRRRPMPRRSTQPRAASRGRRRARPWAVPARGASEYVRWVQSALNQNLALRLPLDGVLGLATRSALRSFQQREGLPVDGIVGPDTERALLAARGSSVPAQNGDPQSAETFEFFNFEDETSTTDRPTLRRGSTGEAVKDLQSRLQRAGHDPGPIDGIFGSRTDAAVRSFQTAQSITIDGIVGPQTWGRLLNTPPEYPGAGIPSTAPTSTQVDTPLPESGAGFYSYTSADKRYGTLATIGAVKAIGAAWNAAHPSGPRIGVGNISKRGGGSFPPHSTHREGLNVDIRPMRNDNREEGVTYQNATYSRTLTQELVNLIYANPVLAVSSILFNDPGIQRVKPYPRHDNHMHLTFMPPVGGGQPTTGYPTTGSSLRSKIVQLALQERKRWQDGALTESDAAAKSILEDYWKTGVDLNDSEAARFVESGYAWSAAFICWVMRHAGTTDFTYNSYHSTYIKAAYDNARQGSANTFKAYSVNEVAPRAGDLVCNTYADTTGTRPPADLARVKAGTPGYHSNIVVSVVPGKLEVIGGNLGKEHEGTVGRETVPIHPNGLVKDPKYFAVIRVG